MADIVEPVIFSAEIEAVIAGKVGLPEFSHQSWGGEDLQAVRRYIRDHYRSVQVGACAYCKNDVSLQAALNCHVEHIAPKALYKKFMFEPKNLCVICADCNAIKREQEVMEQMPDTVVNGARRKIYPRAASAFKVVHPHFDNYDEHIERFGMLYVDKSDKGHFTIGICRLNRKLREFGWEAEFDEADVARAAEDYLAASGQRAKARKLDALKRVLVLS